MALHHARPDGTGHRPVEPLLVDPRAEAPQESRVRVLRSPAGLPAVPRYTVRDADGVFVARGDLDHPAQRVAVEYDGVWHADRAQLTRDRRRLNAW